MWACQERAVRLHPIISKPVHIPNHYECMLAIFQEEIPYVDPVAVFLVTPDKMTIPSKSSCQLELFGFSAQPGQLEEHFVCTLATGVPTLGAAVKAKHIVFDFDVRWGVLLVVFQFVSTLHSLLILGCTHAASQLLAYLSSVPLPRHCMYVWKQQFCGFFVPPRSPNRLSVKQLLHHCDITNCCFNIHGLSV